MSSRYDELDEIGRGGMGVVYRARDQKLGRQVAVKRLREDHLREEKLQERFRREARAVAQLDHPHIVPVYDFGVEDGVPFLVMPYVEGPTLRERIAEEGSLSAEEVARIGKKLAEALGAAHEEGIVHRDVKSQNVLIEGNRPRLTDFGIARLREKTRLTSTNEVLGTPAYMSPEQLEGGDVDRRSDIYSLGAVLYECLSGRPPYEGENMMQLMYAMARGEREPLRKVAPGHPSWLTQVVEQCLAGVPEDRYDSAAALKEALSEGGYKVPSSGPPSMDGSTGEAPSTVVIPAEPVEVDPSWPEDLQEALKHPEGVRELTLRGKHLSELPVSVRQLTDLEVLDLCFNPIETLPPSIGELSKLEIIFVAHTKITKLPEEIGQLSRLAGLNLSGNSLTELPSSIGQLMQLMHLDLEDNELVKLPESIGQLTRLRDLDLSGNELTEVPKSVGQLINLEALRLEDNNLEKTPDSVGQLTSLNVLDLSDNPLPEGEQDRVRRLLPDTKIEF